MAVSDNAGLQEDKQHGLTTKKEYIQSKQILKICYFLQYRKRVICFCVFSSVLCFILGDSICNPLGRINLFLTDFLSSIHCDTRKQGALWTSKTILSEIL